MEKNRINSENDWVGTSTAGAGAVLVYKDSYGQLTDAQIRGVTGCGCPTTHVWSLADTWPVVTWVAVSRHMCYH